MTMKELRELCGGKPYLKIPMMGIPYEVILTGRPGECVTRDLGTDIWVMKQFDENEEPDYSERIFFDNPDELVVSVACTCDFRTVILRIGCQCGGK